ncbi:MAG TPA: hypothetical protein VFC03_16165 [Acidimicrobiales bacterium]|nr:hypothetical protein [Acidimicrobiales bacterium]
MRTAPVYREHSPVVLFPSQTGWQGDVALELWVDVGRRPVGVRLAGTLDGSTAVNLLAVVEELIAEGVREFDLRTAALRVAGPDGADALRELEQLVQRSGGRLTRDGAAIGHTVAGPVGSGETCAAGL